MSRFAARVAVRAKSSRRSKTPLTPDPADAALAAGFDRGWAMLAAAVTDPASGLRCPVVATARGDADARVMVLRAVDRDTGTIAFHTDVRAAKVAAITVVPRVAVVGYDHATRLQLRLHGVAAMTSAGRAVDAAWAMVPPAGRAAYQTADPPGTPVAAPPDAPITSPDAGRTNFAVVTIRLGRFEWLDLATPVHRRAVFVRDSGWHGTWLVP